MRRFTLRRPRLAAGALVLAACAAVAPGLAEAATLSGQVSVSEDFGGDPRPLDDNSNAVIFVSGFQEDPDPQRDAKLVQRDKSFSRRVLPIVAGEEVAFPNEDRIHHNVWSNSNTRPFDLGLYKFPETRTVTFPDPGLVTVFCNIHPQMIATILVLPNNKFAVTDEDGSYRIEGIPEGEWPVYAWVEGAQPQRRTVTFREGEPVKLSFDLTLQRIPVDHLNKHGEPYDKNESGGSYEGYPGR